MKDKWQKLKEWLYEFERININTILTPEIDNDYAMRLSIFNTALNRVICEMRELEGEDVKD